MDTISELIGGTMLDPVLIMSSVAVSVALLSGAVARAIEYTERRPSRPRRAAGSTPGS